MRSISRPTADLTAAELSYGRKRALEIATTLALDPAMLLLDEPMAGMGHEDIGRISDLIRRIARNRTVLMVEHNLNVVADLCDRVTVLARGEILADGTYDKVSRIRGCAKPIWEPSMSNAPLLEVRGLNAWYGESHVLHGVDLDIREGETVTLLGRNGAGKTTTLRAIMGILRRREGVIRLRGKDLLGLPLHRVAQAGLGYVPEERGIFASLNVSENLMLPPKVVGGRHERGGDLHALPQSP